MSSGNTLSRRGFLGALTALGSISLQPAQPTQRRHRDCARQVVRQVSSRRAASSS